MLKNLLFQFLVFVTAIAVGIAVSSLFSVNSISGVTANDSPRIVLQEFPDRMEHKASNILDVLMPNGDWADVSKLDLYPPTEVIDALRIAERDAQGERALAIAFLLAATGEDYSTNKLKLVTALKECRRKPYPDVNRCADIISDYLMKLSRRGDGSLIQTLFDVSDLADGAFSQSLGVFYSDSLHDRPEQFLNALRPFSTKEREDLCGHAGREDGGGMSDERLRAVQERLNAMAAGKRNSIAILARKCLAAVERGETAASQQFLEDQ